jgi:hypothetical protein
LEIAIDYTAFGHLRFDLTGLKGLDRRTAQALLGALVDAKNLVWLVR